MPSNADPKPALGFLTVLSDPQHGLFGGYLLLNMAGRPLEFHCTAPIKPNRAQEILYGPTLESFLYGEQIGQTLLEQAKIEPLVVCTDCPPALAVRELGFHPVALVLPRRHAAGERSGLRRTVPRGAKHAGRGRAVARPTSPLIAERLAELGESFDLAEPFGRIREAIEEAQQAAR